MTSGCSGVFVPVQMLDKFPDASLVAHLGLPHGIGVSAVCKGDGHPGVEESLFPQTVQQHVIIVFCGLKNGGIRLETDKSPPLFGVAGDVERAVGNAPVELDGMDLAIQIDIHGAAIRKGR